MMSRHIRTSVGEILDLAKQEIFEVEVRVILYSKGRYKNCLKMGTN